MSAPLNRIRALLAMAEGKANPHEAANAARLAASLMAEHGITMEQLGRTPSGNRTSVGRYCRGLDEWQNLVMSAAAEAFGCSSFVSGEGPTFFGKGDAPSAAAEVFSWLVEEMRRVGLRSEHWKHGKNRQFMLGMAITVADRLVAKDETPEWALVRASTAEAEMMEEIPGLKKSRPRSAAHLVRDDEGYMAVVAGLIAGFEIDLGTHKPLSDA